MKLGGDNDIETIETLNEMRIRALFTAITRPLGTRVLFIKTYLGRSTERTSQNSGKTEQPDLSWGLESKRLMGLAASHGGLHYHAAASVMEIDYRNAEVQSEGSFQGMTLPMDTEPCLS